MIDHINQLDYPYVVFYFIQMALAYWFWKKRYEKIAIVSLCLTFFFFACRAPVVGADTWNYVRYLTGERDFYNNDMRDLEAGFLLYHKIVSGFSPSRLVVMLLNSVIGLVPLFYMIKKYSKNVPLTILMFCYMGCLNVYFVGLRQTLGLGPMILALLYSIQEHKPLQMKMLYLGLSTVFAYYFHTVCFFYGVIYAVAILIPGGNRKFYLWTVVITAIWGFILQQFDVMRFFNLYMSLSPDVTERINIYFTDAGFETDVSLNILMRPSVIALFTFKFMDSDRLSHPFCKIYLIGVAMFNLMYCVPMVHRMIPPLMMYGAIVFTWSFGKHYEMDRKARQLVNILSVLIVLYFTRAAYIDCSEYGLRDNNRMHPYQFIFEDYSEHSTIRFFDE